MYVRANAACHGVAASVIRLAKHCKQYSHTNSDLDVVALLQLRVHTVWGQVAL